MFFQQVYDKSLAQASYLIGCQATGEAIVIDAKRDVDTYVDLAKQNDLRITKVTETHIHADFLCGTQELAALTDAEIHLSAEGGEAWQYAFPHQDVRHGDVIRVGNLTLEVLHTPGHTPESISFLLRDHPATSEPVIIITGDFVFVGDVGRPDLLEKAAGLVGTKEQGAEEMFDSLRSFEKLPDFVQVWPGHGAGSACGKALGAVANSTVGYEKIRNWALLIKEKNAFVEELLDGQPDPPTYFAKMKELNRISRPLMLSVPQIIKLEAEEFAHHDNNGVQIVDVRNKFDFAKSHLQHSINIQNNNTFATWCGWMLSYDSPIVLIVDEAQKEDVTRKLIRIGMDHILGYIPNMDDVNVDKIKTADVDYAELKQIIAMDQGITVLDVRNRDEYASGHIAGAKSMFVGTLPQLYTTLDPAKPYVVYCQGGDRASIAASFLQSKGFTDVKTYFGSMREWTAHGGEVQVGGQDDHAVQ